MKYDETQRKYVEIRKNSGNNIWGLAKKAKRPDPEPYEDEDEPEEKRHPLSDAVFFSETFMIVESRMNFENFD